MFKEIEIGCRSMKLICWFKVDIKIKGWIKKGLKYRRFNWGIFNVVLIYFVLKDWFLVYVKYLGYIIILDLAFFCS